MTTAAAAGGPHAPFAFAPSVRAVLFDAGNTLLWIDHARIAALLSARGFAADEAAVRRAERRARPLLDPHVAAAGRREGPDVARRYAAYVFSELGFPDDPAGRAAAAEAVLAEWPRLWSRVPDDAPASLARLRARGYRVGVVSNSNGGVRALLEQGGLAQWLECVIDSGAEGVEKPDPEIFRRGAERLGVPASACVYLGDFLSLDVHGARGAGMHAVLLDPDDVWAPRASAAGQPSAPSAGAHAGDAHAGEVQTAGDVQSAAPTTNVGRVAHDALDGTETPVGSPALAAASAVGIAPAVPGADPRHAAGGAAEDVPRVASLAEFVSRLAPRPARPRHASA